MRKIGKIFIALVVIGIALGIASVAYAFPFSVIISAPFPESASLLMLGTGMISVANFVRRKMTN